MSNANEHEEGEIPGWLQLVLFPLLLIAYIRQHFAQRAEQTRARRRLGLRPDWQDFIAELYESEWMIDAIKAEGTRRILAGEELDLNRIAIMTPGLHDVWRAPTSAHQMHLRMLGLARFHADPEFFVHRHAQRIRAAAKVAAAAMLAAASRDPSAPARATTATPQHRNNRIRAGIRVRAPPWRTLFAIPHSLFPGSPASEAAAARLPRPSQPAASCIKLIHRSRFP